MKTGTLIAILACVLTTAFTFAQEKPSDLSSKSWQFVATKMPAEWYGSAEAKSVAKNVLMAQKEIGGWEKNKPYHHAFTESEKNHYLNNKKEIGATFDNGSTITELKFLQKCIPKPKKNTTNKLLKKDSITFSFHNTRMVDGRSFFLFAKALHLIQVILPITTTPW